MSEDRRRRQPKPSTADAETGRSAVGLRKERRAEDEPAGEQENPTGGNRSGDRGRSPGSVRGCSGDSRGHGGLAAPKPEPSHYSIRPPVEVVPPPAPRPPPVTVVTTTVTAAAPPVGQPLTLSDRYDLLLEKDGMVSAGPPAEDDRETRRICQLVANGANPNTLKGGGDDVIRLMEGLHSATRSGHIALHSKSRKP